MILEYHKKTNCSKFHNDFALFLKISKKGEKERARKKGIAFLIVPYSAAVPEHCCTSGKAIAFNAANEVKLSTNQLISQ